MSKKTRLYAFSSVLGFGVTLFLCGGVFAIQTIQSSAPSSQLRISTDFPNHLLTQVVLEERPPKGKAELTWNEVPEPGVKKRNSRIKGYKVYIGTAPRNYTISIDVGGKTKHVFKHLHSGTYYFAVTAYNDTGQESPYSAEVRKTILDSD